MSMSVFSFLLKDLFEFRLLLNKVPVFHKFVLRFDVAGL